MEGIPGLNLCDTIIDILHTSWRYQSIMIRLVTDYLHQKARLLSIRTALYVPEDNEALIKQMKKAEMQQCVTHHAHIVSILDWQYDRNNLDPMIQIKCVNTTQELADIPHQRFSHQRQMDTADTSAQLYDTYHIWSKQLVSICGCGSFLFHHEEICQRIFRCI